MIRNAFAFRFYPDALTRCLSSHRPTIDEQMSVRLVQAAVDAGVTFMDNAWEYHDGESERRMGLALKGGRRDRVTLMTKVCARDGKTEEGSSSLVPAVSPLIPPCVIRPFPQNSSPP